jgi:oligopeptide transport system substrate-binding protein
MTFRNKVMPLSFFKIFIRLGFCLLLVACSNSENPDSDGEVKQILRLAISSLPGTIDPHQVTDGPGAKVLMALNESLLVTDYQTFELKPGVAESWQILDDGMRYNFKLRLNAKWSNGESIKASDFVYSWQRILSAGLGNQYALDYYAIKNAGSYHKGELKDFSQVGVKALSEYELEFTLERRDPLFLKRLGSEITAPVHKATVEKYGAMDDPGNTWIRAGNHVGNGPFKLEYWELNQTMRMVRDPNYWDANAIKLEEVHILPAEGESVEERMYRSGQIDVAYGNRLPTDKIARYKAEQPDEFVSQPAYATYFYLFNTQKPPFNSVDVRKAFSYSVDKQLLTEKVTKNGEPPAYALSPISPAYQPPQMHGFNPALAREHLAKAGYPDGKGFPGVTLTYNTTEIHQKLAVAIQQMWKKELNVDVALENQEWKVFLISRHNLEFDIARAGSASTFADPADLLDSLTTGHGMNDTGWSHAEYDRLIHAAAQVIDPAERFALLHQAEAILVEELPLLPLFYNTYSYLIKPEVKGFEFNMVDHPNFKGVYIDAEKGR